MKIRLVTTLVFLLIAVPFTTLQTACTTTPSAQKVEYQTLKATGETAKVAMDASTQLLKQGSITVQQWQTVANAYDSFQAAWNVALSAARSDLSSITSPDVMKLATDLVALVAQLSNKPTK